LLIAFTVSMPSFQKEHRTNLVLVLNRKLVQKIVQGLPLRFAALTEGFCGIIVFIKASGLESQGERRNAVQCLAC
jgi:hypothetical protein